MKTIALCVLLALACADKEPIPLISGRWEGTMYIGRNPFPIEFDLTQYGEDIAGKFTSPFGIGAIEISDSSKYISRKFCIVAVDNKYGAKYVFSGTWRGDDEIAGYYKMTLYSCSGTMEDYWSAWKKYNQ